MSDTFRSAVYSALESAAQVDPDLERDEYDALVETVEAAHRAELERLREVCAMACNERGKREEEQEGLTRNVQNHYRCRDAIRALDIDAALEIACFPKGHEQ
jgi:hypothetical protein